MHWLASKNLTAELSDMDGVLVLVSEVALNVLLAKQMTSDRYKLLPEFFLVHDVHRIRRFGYDLCNKLTKMGLKGLAYTAAKPVHQEQSCKYACRISCAIKTHNHRAMSVAG